LIVDEAETRSKYRCGRDADRVDAHCGVLKQAPAIRFIEKMSRGTAWRHARFLLYIAKGSTLTS